FRNHPRDPELRVVDRLEVLPERAVVVAPQRGGHIQALLERELFLDEGPERLRNRRGFVGLEDRARRNRRRARRQLVATERAIAGEPILEELQTDGRSEERRVGKEWRTRWAV